MYSHPLTSAPQVGVITTDQTKTDAELVAMAKGWTIVGKDLLSVVSCKEPYEWRQGTNPEWEFAAKARGNTKSQYHVSPAGPSPSSMFIPPLPRLALRFVYYNLFLTSPDVYPCV